MNFRLPLYVQILALLFGNIVLIVAAAWIFLQFQYNPRFDSLLAGNLGDRMRLLGLNLSNELRDVPQSEWDRLLERYTQRYGIEFSVFDGQARPMAGPATNLPESVTSLIRKRSLPLPAPPRPSQRPLPPLTPESPHPHPGPPPPPSEPGEGRPQLADPQPLFMTKTDDEAYWIGLGLDVRGRTHRHPPQVVLVIRSDSLTANGLLFDSRPLLAGAAAIVLLSALFWFPFVRRITGYLHDLTSATEQIAQGHFDVHFRRTRTDELGRLGRAVRDMAHRLDGYVNGQKRFLGDIAHELCSPLARLKVGLSILEQRTIETDTRALQDVKEEAEEISAMVDELLKFSKASISEATAEMQAIEVAPLVSQAIDRENQGKSPVKRTLPDGLWAQADPALFSRAVSNLIRNALRYGKSRNAIEISARAAGDYIEVVISDSGPGVPTRELPKLFDPFYRVEASRSRETGGTGLGLTIVKTCMDTCGGTVTCRNRFPSGLEVTLRLPVASPPMEAPEEEREEPS